MGARLALALALAVTAGPGAAAPKPPTRLFTDDAPIQPEGGWSPVEPPE